MYLYNILIIEEKDKVIKKLKYNECNYLSKNLIKKYV